MAEKYYTCKQCDAEFITSHKRTFCTEKCRWRHKTLQRNPSAILRRVKVECTCKGCGVKYMPKHANRDKYCSRKCAFANKAMSPYVRNGNEYDRPSAYTRVYFKACSHCGKGFVATTPIKSKTCSKDCAKKINCLKEYNRNRSRKVVLTKSCKNCKKLFVSEYGDKKKLFCSERCRRSYGRRVHEAKRRAVELSIESENIDPFKVFERDKWKCCLCGVKTLKSKRGSYDDRAPELDHIIPISKGGKHIYTNVQCSCRKCNGAKSNKELGQLLLFG